MCKELVQNFRIFYIEQILIFNFIEMLRLKAKELRESEELQRQRATEEKAVQRLPELRKQFSVIEHARDMQAQYRLSIEAQEGRWEALNVFININFLLKLAKNSNNNLNII